MSPKYPSLLAIVSLLVAGLAAYLFITSSSRDDESVSEQRPDPVAAIDRGPTSALPPAESEVDKVDREPIPDASLPPEDPLGAIAATFRGDHPNLAGFEDLIEQLARQAIFDPDSIESDDRLFRASIKFSGCALVGTVRRLDGKCFVQLYLPLSPSERLAHAFRLQLNTSFDCQEAKATNIQSALSFRPAPPSQSEGDAGWERLAAEISSSGSRLGYELQYQPGGVAVTPREAQLVDDPEHGRAVSDAGMSDATFPWASTNVRPYETWAALIENTARQHRGTAKRK